MRTLVVNFYLGKDIQLNCSALLNENDVIYWNTWRKNGKDPNVHEGEVTACNVGDLGLIPVLGRSPGEGKGYPL